MDGLGLVIRGRLTAQPRTEITTTMAQMSSSSDPQSWLMILTTMIPSLAILFSREYAVGMLCMFAVLLEENVLKLMLSSLFRHMHYLFHVYAAVIIRSVQLCACIYVDLCMCFRMCKRYYIQTSYQK